MGFTTRELATLVELMSNKNIAEERSHLCCPASCTTPVQPTQAPKPQAGCGGHSSRPSQGGWAGTWSSPQTPQVSTKGTESCANCGTRTRMMG